MGQRCSTPHYSAAQTHVAKQIVTEDLLLRSPIDSEDHELKAQIVQKKTKTRESTMVVQEVYSESVHPHTRRETQKNNEPASHTAVYMLRQIIAL